MLAGAVLTVSCKDKNEPDEPEVKNEFKVTLPSNGPLSVYSWTKPRSS